jgi:hypothetical protein
MAWEAQMRFLWLINGYRRRFLILAEAISLFIIIGCSGQSRLVPGPGTTLLPGSNDAVDVTVAGVHLIVDAEAWPGDPAILQQITPLKVTIENDSDKSLLIRYRDFAITSPTGKYYAALPPFKIRGSVNAPFLADRYPPIAEPAFDYDDFLVAPYYSTIYPKIPPIEAEGDFALNDEGLGSNLNWLFYDPFYYSEYYAYWQTVDLPTPRMLGLAIPEGVVKKGGRVAGFLYFEEVSPRLKMVNFRFDLVSANSGRVFGTIEIPFIVMKE